MAMATSETICKFNQSGYCKYGSHCRKHHVTEVCPNIQCTMASCLYSTGTQGCAGTTATLGNANSPIHAHIFTKLKMKPLVWKQKMEIEKLRVEVEELRKLVCDLKMKVSAVSQGQTCSNTTFSRVDTKFSTQSSVRGSLSVINEHEPYQEVIPQLDGMVVIKKNQ